MKKNVHKHIIIYCILFVILVAGITVLLFPYFEKLSEPQAQRTIQLWVDKMGLLGFFAILGIQLLQVIIAFIPGEPVELLSGALYGAFGGLLICLLGCVIASTIIFMLSKRLGKKLLNILFGEEKVHTWKWLQDSKKCTTVTFILFLIPGTPKDMLTYIVGVTDMGVGKFIGISTLARIPSILSSTLIGSTMRQGKWEISLIAFFITGIIGIIGIRFQDKIIDFCHRQTKREPKSMPSCECLDFVEASHRNKVYPLMYCHLEIKGIFDVHCLKKAIQLSFQYIPEILCAYDFARGYFVEKNFTVDDIIILNGSEFENSPKWDLSRNPQLKVAIHNNGQMNFVLIGMSHILADGEGFLQYLYLLAALYNGDTMYNHLSNNRDISPCLESIHVQQQTEQTKHGKRKEVPPLRAYNNGKEYICVNSQISPQDFRRLQKKSKAHGVTLNDVFMTAYARTIAHLQDVDTVILPCPADLRRYHRLSDSLTIANMTGIYRRITIEIAPQHTFYETLLQVHIEMELQKQRYRCFAGIPLLNRAFHKIPRPIVGQIIKANYRLLPVSYTNIGRIDHEKLLFKNCGIKSCYITGTYRLPPDFQLSISTFQNVCTLNCTLIGTSEDYAIGRYILEQVKQELLQWASN